MQKICPTTYYDVIKKYRPEFLADIQSYAAERGMGPDRARLDEKLDLKNFKATIVAELARYGRKNLSLEGVPTFLYEDNEIISAIPKDVRAKYIESLLFEYAHFLTFETFGRKTFFFNDNLTERLADTEMNVDAGMLTLPFPSCLFVFGNRGVRESMHAISKSDPGNEGVVSVFLNLAAIRGERVLEIAAAHTHAGRTIAIVKRELNVDQGKTLEEAMRTEWPLMEDMKNVLPDRVFYEEGLKFIRTVMNAVLYLASSNPDVVPGLRDDRAIAGMSPREIRTHEKKLRHGTKLHYISVGNHCPAYKPDESLESGGSEERMLIRGHWKMQVHGIGRSSRKLLHIEPYWRGPDMAEVVSKPYFAR